jgi:uncharacterized membrane protein
MHSHFRRHRYFYFAILIGAVAWAAASFFAPRLRLPIAVDAFFGSYVLLIFALAANATPRALRALAEIEDEGAWVITLITLAAIAFSLYLIFALLRDYNKDTPRLVLSVLSAPLGWAMLHTLQAFHYAHMYYTDIDKNPQKRVDAGGLKFPACDDPGGWDFLYYAFVVGMTAQVSDVQVTSTPMRRATIVHGIASFFINTGLLAVAVNVVVAIAGK